MAINFDVLTEFEKRYIKFWGHPHSVSVGSAMRELIGRRIRYSIPRYKSQSNKGEGKVTEAQVDWVQVDGHKNVHKDHITHIESGMSKDGWASVK